jgi:hypothetical protein
MWIISGALVFFFLDRIDNIMNVQLYEYHLEYSLVWATSYWMYMRLIYVSLFIPMGISLVAVVSSIVRTRFWAAEAVISRPPQLKTEPGIVRGQTVEKGGVSTLKQGVSAKEERGMVISCPKCKKVFAQPMLMLNFEGSKGVLVNVCPYCNRVLGRAENGNEQKIDTELRFAYSDSEPVPKRTPEGLVCCLFCLEWCA